MCFNFFGNRIVTGILINPLNFSGDLLQHFLTVIFDRLSKGESSNDDFELNIILQVTTFGELLSRNTALIIIVISSKQILFVYFLLMYPCFLLRYIVFIQTNLIQNCNGYLQESIRNSADAMLLSSPDALVVSISSEGSLDRDKDDKGEVKPRSSTRKSRVNNFGIDCLESLKFTYKV